MERGERLADDLAPVQASSLLDEVKELKTSADHAAKDGGLKESASILTKGIMVK